MTENGIGKRKGRVQRLVTYNGQEWMWTRLAEAHGMSYQTLSKRVDKLGMSLEEALTTPIREIGNIIEIDGIRASVLAHARRAGRPETTVRERLKRGVKGKMALSPRKLKRTNRKKYYDSVTYAYRGEDLTLREISDRTQIKYHSLYYRMSIGMTVHEAIASVYALEFPMTTMVKILKERHSIEEWLELLLMDADEYYDERVKGYDAHDAIIALIQKKELLDAATNGGDVHAERRDEVQRRMG